MRTLRRRYLRRSGPFNPSTKVLCWEPGGEEVLKVEGLRPSEVQTFEGTFKGRDLQRYLQRSRPFEGSLEGRDPSKVPSKGTFKGTFKGPDPSKVAWKVATLRKVPSKVQVPMCKVCTEAVHAVAITTRATLGLDMCEVCTEAVHAV